MQYLKEMPDGTRVPVTHDEWLAYSITDKHYQVIMHTAMIVVFRVHNMREMKAPPRYRYGGHGECSRNPTGYGGW